MMKKRSNSSAQGATSETARMEREQWLSIQLAIGDSQKFLDLLGRLKWEEGLTTDAVNLIESTLSTTSRGTPHSRKGGKTLDVAGIPSAGPGDGSLGREQRITVSMAKHAAESAATMCAFAVAIVEYQHSLKPYQLAREKLER